MSAVPGRSFVASEPPFPGFLLVGVVLGIAAAVMSVRPAGPGRPSGEAVVARVDEGESLTAYGCTACHSTSAGAVSELGPSLAGAVGRGAARIADPDYRGSAADVAGWLAESISDHCADVPPGWSCEGVDAYGNWLSLEEVARLADLVAALPGGP